MCLWDTKVTEKGKAIRCPLLYRKGTCCADTASKSSAVMIDHLIVTCYGRLNHSKGKNASAKMAPWISNKGSPEPRTSYSISAPLMLTFSISPLLLVSPFDWRDDAALACVVEHVSITILA